MEGARAVHHIESPAMVSLCRMTNVREIDGLVAIVSVIRPGAANENKKMAFTRRYQGMEPPEYPHPSLEDCLRSTYGLVVYEEHILQICEAFAGMPPGRADVLRRALVKQKRDVVNEIGEEFATHALARGHAPEKILEVWELVTGFNGYAFCKAHSTAYGVEAYQAAWLKRYHPLEFMAGVLTNGKGFYHPLVYVLECHRIGIPMLPPSIKQPGPAFTVEAGKIRVPATRTKGLTERTKERLLAERKQKPFASLKDFYLRLQPKAEELEALMRVGSFDEFGQTRTQQFTEVQYLTRTFGGSTEPGQGWLLPPPSLDKLPMTALQEPKPHLLDLYRIDSLGKKGEVAARMIEEGRCGLLDVSTKDLRNKLGDRQAIQLEGTRKGKEFLSPQLVKMLKGCKYPLHFIDFEASRVAVPYHPGMKPYEQVAFQWSCHTIKQPGGKLEHAEWINIEDA